MNRIFPIFVFFFCLSSCGIKKELKDDFSVQAKNVRELIERINTANKIPEWLYLTGRIKLIKEKQEVSLNINIKYRKDSLICASITAPFGIELFRIKLSKDSICFINRKNQTYFKQPILYIADYLNEEISFNEINEMITSNLRTIKESYKLETESTYYIIKSKTKQYKIDKKTYRILQAVGKNETRYTLSNFKEKEGYLFPYNFSLHSTSTEESSIILNYKKIVFDQPQKISFKIPNYYVEVK